VPARRPTRTPKASTVYFAPAAVTDRRGPYRAMEALFRKVVTKDTIAKGDYVAIKLHFGEETNVRYIRPTFIRCLADLVKRSGGQAFATDTLTLYKRKRHSLFDHLETAAGHGFTRETLGCPVLIADGLRSSGVEVPVHDGLELDSSVVAQAIYDADVLINVAHLTLHDEIPLAAAIKNISMGCVTRETKLRCHGTGVHPNFDSSRCVLCGHCLRMCPGDAFTLKRRKIHFDESLCVSCGDCFAWCEGGALDIPWGAETQIVQRRTCDAARGVLATFAPEKTVHFVIAMDITAGCDCVGASDLPIVPDLGIFASTDMVALDMAVLDAMQAAPAYPGSQVDGTPGGEPGGDKIAEVSPRLDLDAYREILAKSRLGNPRYQLKRV
jgi:uncharacterized Fe-S center protein